MAVLYAGAAIPQHPAGTDILTSTAVPEDSYRQNICIQHGDVG